MTTPTSSPADDPSLWDAEYVPSASAQHRRRLARDSASLARLAALLTTDPGLAGKLRHVTPELDLSKQALFFSGTWSEVVTPVLAKLDPMPREFFWLTAPGMSAHAPGDSAAAGDDAGAVPVIFASGDTLSGVPVRWLVMERLPHRLVRNATWDARWDMIAAAGARFQAVASHVPDPLPHCEPIGVEWIRRSLTMALEQDPPPGAESALTRLVGRLDHDWQWVLTACPESVLAGDLHLANALCRTPPPAVGHAFLIDPIPRFGPWAFDPAYCQTISANADVGLVARFAGYRSAAGLPMGQPADLPRIAALHLAWLASMWWVAAAWRREDRKWAEQTVRYLEYGAE